MSFDFFTIVLTVFVFLMYLYLFLVRSSVLIKGKKNFILKWMALFFAIIMFLLAFSVEGTPNQVVKNSLSGLLFLSFLLDSKGLTEDRIITTPFDNRGILYKDIEKVVLLKKAKEIRMNYFRKGRRGPMMVFSISLEELIPFLAERLNEEAELSIVIDED